MRIKRIFLVVSATLVGWIEGLICLWKHHSQEHISFVHEVFFAMAF